MCFVTLSDMILPTSAEVHASLSFFNVNFMDVCPPPPRVSNLVYKAVFASAEFDH
jgi:hypothetical protein